MSTASRPLSSLGELATTRKTTAEGPDAPSKIDVDSMNFYYGDKRALQDISIRIKPNVVTAFIGPSGCGTRHSDRTDSGAVARHRRDGAAHHDRRGHIRHVRTGLDLVAVHGSPDSNLQLGLTAAG